MPQGSILGPLFFILYVNDLNNAFLLDVILFADDTNLFISHNNPIYLNDTLNSELNNLVCNILFKPRQKKQLFEFHVSINEQPIPSDSETMFLGVFVDDNLSWKSHISLLASKLSKSIGIMHKSRFFSLNSFSSNFVQFNDTSILILLQSSLGWHLKKRTFKEL